MAITKITLGLKGSGSIYKSIFNLILTILLISFLFGCAAKPTTTLPPAVDYYTDLVHQSTTTPTLVTTLPATPQGELTAALQTFGNESFLPWRSDTFSSEINDLVYDLLIYYDEINQKYIPGLAEGWETSTDAMTLTYHLRKGIQFSDGWGELTSEDVKYSFEKQATPNSNGQAAAKQIASMDTPDPYTLVLHFKKPQPIFFATFSMGSSGICQGIVCKKYIETVSETTASQKPIGTGPYKMVDSQLGSYYKFEALERHWRVVPEFKTLIVRLIPEVSTVVAMLKTKEVDIASVPAEQLSGLKASGIATEVSPAGGAIMVITWGGISITVDSRYDEAYHNKDPWIDIRVRKAMSLAIDRQAICNTIFAGGAFPAGVPMFSPGMDKYQYPYDPATAKQLLVEAGYPNGFSFDAMSYPLQGIPEGPRVMEALAGYWQQIGLDPKITVIDYNAYNQNYRNTLKNVGDISLNRVSKTVDLLDRAPLYFMPGALVFAYMDEGSYAIWKEGSAKVNPDERAVYADKLQQYFHENYYGPVVRIAFCFAWNSEKIAPFPHPGGSVPFYLEYVRHAQPLNTFRLFTPWPGR